MNTSFPYQFTEPPPRLKKAKLDNIALVPASLLLFKGIYQPMANNFPAGSVLCVPGTQRQLKIMAKVTSFFRDRGHQVITIPIEKISQPMKKVSRPQSENLSLAF